MLCEMSHLFIYIYLFMTSSGFRQADDNDKIKVIGLRRCDLWDKIRPGIGQRPPLTPKLQLFVRQCQMSCSRNLFIG